MGLCSPGAHRCCCPRCRCCPCRPGCLCCCSRCCLHLCRCPRGRRCSCPPCQLRPRHLCRCSCSRGCLCHRICWICPSCRLLNMQYSAQSIGGDNAKPYTNNFINRQK